MKKINLTLEAKNHNNTDLTIEYNSFFNLVDKFNQFINAHYEQGTSVKAYEFARGYKHLLLEANAKTTINSIEF